MKVTSLLVALAAAAVSVQATGLSGQTCQDGTPAPVPTTASPTPTTAGPDPTKPTPTTAGPDPTKPTPTTAGPDPTKPTPTTAGPDPTTPTPTTAGPDPTTKPTPTTTGPDPTTPTPTTAGPDPTKPTPTTAGPDPTTPTPTTAGPDPTKPTPTTVAPTPDPTTTAPPPPPVDCVLYTATTDPSPWGPCAADSTGAFYRTKVLGVLTPASNGGKACPLETDASRSVKELCPPVKCVPFTVAEDTGAYSTCFLKDGKYIKSKVLGIKEEAQNGGTCLESERTVTEPCAGVDCEVYTADEDKGPFGDCKKDHKDGKYYKSKVLGIKTPAQFGGLCPSEEQRTLKELCPAVKCELYKPEEDPGQFGECRVKRDGKYYRSKVLGVKTPAQYGGKDCGSIEQRTYWELCAAVNCVALTPAEDKGPFGDCKKDYKDGKYYKSKVLGVKTPAANGGTCDEKARVYRELCAAVDCVVFTKEEDVGPFGACKKNNRDGKYYKSKVLGIKTPAQFGGRECVSEAKRTVSEVCPPVNCVPFNVADDKGPYGPCVKNPTTGKYVKSKVLGVKEPAKYGGSCDPKDRAVTAPCDSVDCEVKSPEEDKGPFGACKLDTTDGKYYKSKVLAIKKPAQFGGLCPSEEQRTYRVLCPAVNCVPVKPEDDEGPFGACTLDTSDSKYYKSKVLGVKSEAQYGGTCLESDRTVRELCAGVNCEVYTPEEDPGQFGDCMPNAEGKYYKSKVLGIKTAAQYGGTACPSEADRSYSLLCPPVNCVAVAPEDDMGKFGDCTKDDKDGKYYKSKVLGVKTPESNGGTCLESDRTVRELCPAEDCVPYSMEEDPGQFGDCTPNAEGKYYKSKVLGIKTPAKFGGAECESEAKRTVSEFCPPIKCVPFNVAEDQGAYGECVINPTSGKYFKSKVLGIKEEAKNGGTCLESDRTVTEPCAGVDCEVNSAEEDKGPFGECKVDANDGKFYKSKVLGIKKPAQYDGLCPSEAQRTYRELCPAVNCVPLAPADDKGPFGLCTLDNTDGKYYKSKVLGVKTDGQYGGTCLESDRTYRELCAPINCEVKTVEEDLGPFGDCKDNGFGRFFKSKVLGIKVPGQYGGTPCPSEEQRTHKELCPAVPCVIYTPAEDPGAFGACTKNNMNGKYYKSKVLGVKTGALYGGSCPSTSDPSRQYKEQCPPVDCVVTKEEDDKQPFSSCTRFPDRKYYRTKVLPIITAAAFGGKACPSEADRTVKELCPDDGYCLPSDPFYDQCVPGLRKCGDKIKDKVYDGHELQLVKGVQLWECCDKCATTAGCVAYSFVPSSNTKNNECSLKWKADGTSWKNGAISSKVVTPTASKCSFIDGGFNTLPTSNIKSVTTDSLAVCCDACVTLSGCKTFNFKDNKCELKEYNSFSIVNYLFAGSWRSGSVN